MTDHFYVLQYHLYTLALHRYLTLRVLDYDYGRHFGGVFYIFLRGVSATDGSTESTVPARKKNSSRLWRMRCSMFNVDLVGTP